MGQTKEKYPSPPGLEPQAFIHHSNHFHDLFYSSPRWIKINGEYYHIFDYIIIGRQAIDDPSVFAEIIDIFLILDCPVLEVIKYRMIVL